MKKDAGRITAVGIILFGVITLLIATTPCGAQEWSRKNKAEIFGFGQAMSGDTTTGLGVELEMDDTTVGGFGLGFNLSENLNFYWDMFFGSTDFTGRRPGSTRRADTDLFGLDFNLDYNILKSRFTPLITGGFGFVNFSGTWLGGYPITMFDETDFSYNLGAGFRWDVTNHFLIKAIYRATWTKLEDTDKSIQLDGISVSIGYVF